jgi:nucleoside-diphosphate-sugar epimerase
LSHINVAIFNIIGIPPLAPFLAPTLLDYTQRDYTFNSNKAFVDFGYKPLFTVEEAIRRRVELYKSEKKNLK